MLTFQWPIKWTKRQASALGEAVRVDSLLKQFSANPGDPAGHGRQVSQALFRFFIANTIRAKGPLFEPALGQAQPLAEQKKLL